MFKREEKKNISPFIIYNLKKDKNPNEIQKKKKREKDKCTVRSRSYD